MPDTPLQSNFADDGRPDTEITLALGAKVISCTLAADLSESETNMLVLDDAGTAPRRNGVAVIDGELIYYGIFDQSDPTHLYDLIRGQDGTTPATHLSGASVTIYGPSRFGNPAIPNAVIAAQQELIDLRSIVDNLQARVTALEEA